MKTVKFKREDMRIEFKDSNSFLTSENLTFDKYEMLIKMNPNYAAFFIVSDKQESKKTKKFTDDIQTEKSKDVDSGSGDH